MAEDKKSQLLEKPSGRWRIISVASIALVIGVASVYIFSRFRSNIQTYPSKSHKSAPVRVAITALGRLEPQGEITHLSAPSSLSGTRVEKLLVKEGDTVRFGQIVALLQDYARATAALEQAQDKVKVAQAQLAQVKAGAKSGDISAQKATLARLETQLKGEVTTQQATIARLQAELDNAQTENNRYQQLYSLGAISASIADSKRLQLLTVRQQLTEAKANLNKTVNTLDDEIKEAKARLASISEVRHVDVLVAEAQLKSTITAVTQAKAERDLTYVISPMNGKVLKVHTKTGEAIGNSGIIEIGKTSQMYVVAEVYQTDIEKVRLGQKATMTSTAFTGKLSGTVSEIGLQVSKQSILNLNPGVDTDRRVISVKIRIDNPVDSQRVAGLTNLQVDVAIQI
ncbi:ABC exporter membrane fusion protein [Scytonema sp. PCC 10023]|uniref:ABC exporter membrane fusion protein n=1 Tax=Scytonema sp. PCC 10023 TaxID=1680591 RepID=UPI0039C74958